MTLALSIDYSRITMNTMGPPTGQHLIVNTFGTAILYQGDEELARSDGGIMPAIGTNDFDYRVRVNASGAFDIQRRTRTPVVPINLLIEDSNGPIVHLNVTSDAIVIPPRYHISRNSLTQNFSLSPQPAFGGGFRIRLLASNVLRRIDMRYLNHSWVTVFISARRVLAIRLQGEEMAEVLYEICTRVSTYGANDNNTDYGLRPAPRARSRQPSPSQTNTRYGSMANQTPAPIPRSRPANSGNPTPTQSRQISPNREEESTVEVPRLVSLVPGAYGPNQPMDPTPTVQTDRSRDTPQGVFDTFEMPKLVPLNIEETGAVPKNEAASTEVTEHKFEAGPSGIQASPKMDRRKAKKVKAMAKMLVSEIATQWSEICNNMASSEEEGEIHDEE